VFDFFVSLLQTILSVEKEDGSLTPDIVNSRVFGDILMFMWDDLVAAEVTAEQCVRLFTEIVNVTECPKPVVDGTHAFICLVVANCSRVTYGDSEFYGIGFKYNGNPQAAHRWLRTLTSLTVCTTFLVTSRLPTQILGRLNWF